MYGTIKNFNLQQNTKKRTVKLVLPIAERLRQITNPVWVFNKSDDLMKRLIQRSSQKV